MSQVLVDSSVWIELFRDGKSPSVRVLGELLRQSLVCTHGLIRAEILSGAASSREYRVLNDGFSALPALADPSRLWDRVAIARYRLARRGFQAGIADLVVAAVASHHGRTLFTLDADFHKIKEILPFKIFSANN